ncbi:MAG: PD40 domain-containing protein, partial [Anaerolineae bacterium]|nr:PD40 domain-containing protein [Anaerolineae bacterium]
WLAFQSKRDGDYEIYVVDVSCVEREGGCENSIMRLTEQIGRDILPAWSPDGQMIAFTSERDGNAELYTMSLESGSVRRLTDSPEHEFSPLWSPDGEQLLFQRTVAGSDLETFVMDMESGAIRRLTTVDMFLQNPSWRPS